MRACPNSRYNYIFGHTLHACGAMPWNDQLLGKMHITQYYVIVCVAQGKLK